MRDASEWTLTALKFFLLFHMIGFSVGVVGICLSISSGHYYLLWTGIPSTIICGLLSYSFAAYILEREKNS